MKPKKRITTRPPGADTPKINRAEPRTDTLLNNLITLKLPKEIVKEIKLRKKQGQPRTQISREMSIPKLHINRILELMA